MSDVIETDKHVQLQSLLGNRNIQTGQTLPSRKRFRSTDENDSETM